MQGPHSFPWHLSPALHLLYCIINSNSILTRYSLSHLFLILPAKDTELIFLLATALCIFEDLHIACSPLSPLGFPSLSHPCFFRPLWQVMFWRTLSFSSILFPNCSLQIQTSHYSSGPPCLICVSCRLKCGLYLWICCFSATTTHWDISWKALHNEEGNLPVSNIEATPENVSE